MALPSTGSIAMAQVASELGVSPTGINLNASNVRTLAGKASGAIGMSDLRGKSGVSSLAASVTPNPLYDATTVSFAGNTTYLFSASVSGGATPYSYSWSTNTGTIVGGTTGSTFQVKFSWGKMGAYYSGEVRCVVTDNAGTQRTVVVPVQLEFYGDGILA